MVEIMKLKLKYSLLLTIALLFCGSGFGYGQAHLSFTNVEGFPQVVSQGSHHDLEGWIINLGNAAFSGQLRIELHADTSSTITLDNNFVVSNLAPGDSVAWSRNNYNFPPGHFRQGNNDIIIWPTAPAGGVDVDSVYTTMYFTEGAAFKLIATDFDPIAQGLDLFEEYDIRARAVNISDAANSNEVCLYMQIPDHAPQCLDPHHRSYGLNDVVSFDMEHLIIWDFLELTAMDTIGVPIDRITFYSLEAGESTEPLNTITLPLSNRLVAAAAPTAAALVKVFPNPVAETLHVTVPQDWSADAVITIHDLAGRLLLQQPLPTERVDVRMLPAGSYLLEIQSRKGIHRQQLICR